MKAFSIIPLTLLMVTSGYGLNLKATCINENTELSHQGDVRYLMVGETVIITEILEDTVVVMCDQTESRAGRRNFKIKYEQGLALVAEALTRKKYEGSKHQYTEDDLRTSPAVEMFLDNSFELGYSDILRNEVFARHGDVFKNKFYRDLFQRCGWYKTAPEFNVLELNGFELANIKWLKDKRQALITLPEEPIFIKDLVAYYPFNGNARDASGNGNHGEVCGPKLTDDRFGRYRSAYYFDGRDDFITVPYAPSLNPTDAITVSAWVKATTWGPASISNCILNSEQNSPDKGWGLRGGMTTATFFVSSQGWRISTTGGGVVSADKWHHLVGVCDGSTVCVYVDGKQKSICGCGGALTPADCEMRIGTQVNGLSFFQGSIDDVRIYGRALSQKEIITLYHESNWK